MDNLGPEILRNPDIFSFFMLLCGGGAKGQRLAASTCSWAARHGRPTAATVPENFTHWILGQKGLTFAFQDGFTTIAAVLAQGCLKNKPAAQAAGSDPPPTSSTTLSSTMQNHYMI